MEVVVPAATLLNGEARALLIERLQRVRPDAQPAWGTLDAPRMLCHLADNLRVALGDVPAKPTHNFASRTLVKFLVVNTGLTPPRGKIQTAPEMLTSKPATWEADMAACVKLVERVGTGSARAVHPAFGPLSVEEWGRLCWKHTNHHLVQFGV
jgi:hypothetical protein